jgi:hypothetical protein
LRFQRLGNERRSSDAALMCECVSLARYFDIFAA